MTNNFVMNVLKVASLPQMLSAE